MQCVPPCSSSLLWPTLRCHALSNRPIICSFSLLAVWLLKQSQTQPVGEQLFFCLAGSRDPRVLAVCVCVCGGVRVHVCAYPGVCSGLSGAGIWKPLMGSNLNMEPNWLARLVQMGVARGTSQFVG